MRGETERKKGGRKDIREGKKRKEGKGREEKVGRKERMKEEKKIEGKEEGRKAFGQS